MIDKDTPLLEVAAQVCSVLSAAGVQVTLSGGAVVSIYTENEFQSFDLDFIGPVEDRLVAAPLEKLGFVKKGRHFVHRSGNPYFVEFPGSVLMAGGQYIAAASELAVGAHKLQLLTPSDAVKDRLAAYLHWKDMQSLQQARAISILHPIDWPSVRTWLDSEGCAPTETARLLALLQAKKAR